MKPMHSIRALNGIVWRETLRFRASAWAFYLGYCSAIGLAVHLCRQGFRADSRHFHYPAL